MCGLQEFNPFYHYVAIGRHQNRAPSADAKYVAGLR